MNQDSREITPARTATWLERRSDFSLFLALYLIALLARVLISLAGDINAPFISDSEEYFSIATSMVQGTGYSLILADGIPHLTAKRVPGTSLMLVVGLLTFGQHNVSGRLMAVLVSSFSAPLLFLLSRRVTAKSWAVLAGLAGGLYPSWLFHSTNVLSESFFVPFLLLAFLLTIRAVDSTRLSFTCYAGLAWGATILFRPTALPMVALVGLYLLWRAGWKHGVLLWTAALLMLAPWVVRNRIVFGHPILATQGGEAFLGANNPYVVDDPENHGLWLKPMKIPEYRAELSGIVDEMELDKREYQISFAYLGQYPGVIPRLAVYKLDRFLTPIIASRGAVRIIEIGSYGALLVLLVIGLFLRVYKRSPALDLAILWSIVLFAATVVYWGINTRGRMLLELVWIPWAILALQAAANRVSLFRYTKTQHFNASENV